MGKLSSAVVQRKLASLRDVEEALARQVLYGGDFVTNLLEQVAAIDEAALVGLIGETQGLPPGPSGELPRAPENALLTVPGDIALRHNLYPIAQEGGALTVVVAEPVKPEVEQDLGFALGISFVQRASLLVRIRQAISRDYGLPLDRRSQRVVARLEGRADPSPSIAPAPLASAPDISALPRPPSIPPMGLPEPTDLSPLYPAASVPPVVATSHVVSIGDAPASRDAFVPSPPAPSTVPSAHEAVTAPAPQVVPMRHEPTPPLPAPNLIVKIDERTEAPMEAPSPARRAGSGQFAIPVSQLAAWSVRQRPPGPRRGRARRRGPYTAADAEQDLFGAEGREEALTAFFDFVSQYFEYSALFAVQGDLAEGRDAYGPGADRNKVADLGVPLDMPGALADARASGRFNLTALGHDGIDGQLAKDLDRPAGKKVLLLPIIVRQRCVLMLYGDYGDADVELSEVGDVIAFAPLVATALENVILRRKAAVRTATGGDPNRPVSLGPGVRSRAPLPTRDERVEALAQALETTVRPVDAPEPPVEKPSNTHSHKTDPAVPSVRPGRPDSLAKDKAGEPRLTTPAQGTPVRASLSQPPEGPVFELTRRATPAIDSEDEPPEEDWDVPEEQIGGRRPPPLPSDAPEISIGVADADPDLPEVEPPSSEMVHATARAPHKRYSSDELRLPKVIVNVDNDLEKLVERLVAGDEAAVARVVELGARAASILVARFPGPIKQDSDRLGAPRPASQRGPILRALARIGLPAVPFIAVRTNDGDPHIRAYATRLLGEIPSTESAQAVARRVMDTDADVRRAALDAGKLLTADEESKSVVRDRVASIAEDPNGSIDARVAAIEALAHFRDEKAVPRLLRLVVSDDEVGQSAQWALGLVTRQSFGRDKPAWEAWWRDNGSRHRIEWLIDALMHEDAENRRAAGEELKALTKEYFGYYDDLSRGERLKAQKRYRDWWENTGKARFSKK